MNELHVVVIVSQVPEFVCKQLRKTVMQLCTSLSMPESSARIVPRYLKYGTTESSSNHFCLGGVDSQPNSTGYYFGPSEVLVNLLFSWN